MKSKPLNVFLPVLPAIIASLSAFLLLIYLCLNFTLFSRSSMLNALNSSGYYTALTQKLNEKMSEECLQYDIMPSVLDTYINEDIIKKEMTVRVNSFYKRETMISATRFFEFDKAVEKMLVEQTGQNIDMQQKSKLMRLSVALESIWATAIQLPVQNLTQFLIFNAKPQLQEYALVFAILLILSAYICTRLINGFKNRLKIFSNIAYGAGLSCIIFGVSIPVFKLTGTMPKDNLLYEAYTHWTNSFVIAIILAGVIVTGLMLFIKIYFKKPRSKPQH